MYKKIVLGCLILLMLLASSSKFFIIVHFYAHQKEIIAEYCINKNNPEKHCNGHCHLEKTLQQEDSSKNTEKQININFLSVEFCETVPNWQFELPDNETIIVQEFRFENTYQHTRIKDFFHPPLYS